MVAFNLSAQRYQGELMVTVCGMTGQDTSWTVTASAKSSIRWHENNNKCYLTTGYSSASVSGVGNGAMPNGFEAPLSDCQCNRDLAFGLYRLSWDLPSPHSDPAPIDIDFRDADWAHNYSEIDVTIRYNITEEKYQVRIGGAGQTYYSLSHDTIWDILDETPPNKQALQPTTPRNFVCANTDSVGQHPKFEWDAPSNPSDVIFRYKIYRSGYLGQYALVDSGFSDTDWADDEIVIDPGGNNFWYYAKAYTHYSPDSDPSSLAKIKGNPSKPLTKEPEHNNIIRQNILKLHLTTFPNPLNSNTTIHYTIPRDGHVRLVIYNIYGQRVMLCVDRSQDA